MNYSLVPENYVDDMWPRVYKHLLSTLEFTDIGDMETIQKDLHDGNTTMWIVYEDNDDLKGTVIVRILETKNDQRVLNIDYLSGVEAKSWVKEFTKTLESYAKAYDCSAIRFTGRKEWDKSPTLAGFKHTHSTFEKELN